MTTTLPIAAEDQPANRCIVAVVDDCRLLCDALTLLLNQCPWVETAIGISSAEGMGRIADLRPHVVMFAPSNDGAAGEWTRRLAAAGWAGPTVAFSVEETETSVLACVELGVDGMLQRSGDLEELRAVVQRVLAGQTACSPGLGGVLLRRLGGGATTRGRAEPDPLRHITPREREVLELLERGWSNQQIARELCIEVRTVKNHVHHLLDKMQVSRRGEAAARLRALRDRRTLSLVIS
ncbi:response regulator transcription factor [Nakamurella flava]|uniref:Response regulator transcription factor n=1 Tax=Nakamurella flava TaxID=2576308 RepID=A0A4V6CRU2_9ACTN|nr:response regulator transcription factor [Nakamurella flava]TKV58815.1 response regulator transcription factor [Nakamurella flava]